MNIYNTSFSGKKLPCSITGSQEERAHFMQHQKNSEDLLQRLDRKEARIEKVLEKLSPFDYKELF